MNLLFYSGAKKVSFKQPHTGVADTLGSERGDVKPSPSRSLCPRALTVERGLGAQQTVSAPCMGACNGAGDSRDSCREPQSGRRSPFARNNYFSVASGFLGVFVFVLKTECERQSSLLNQGKACN